MFLKHLSLQNFRNYSKKDFNFSQNATLIVGPNTSGKSNLIEAIFFIASGHSFRIDRDEQLVKFEENIARIKARAEEKDLEVIIAKGGAGENLRSFKKYLVNGVSKRRMDFIGNFFAVIFAPNDLEVIVGSPGMRRNFMDNILTQTDRDYRLAMGFYEKGLRIRNALLHKVRETGKKLQKEFEYWDNLLITQGQKITKKREYFIEYLTVSKKDILNFKIIYDKSIISEERLSQYEDAEVVCGITLIGPHRDDFMVYLIDDYDIRFFGSRGQQRLAILQLKILELNFIEKATQSRPLLLLDDIFSELDKEHINLVLDMIGNKQTIMTTTHKEFIPKRLRKNINVIKLGE